MYKTALVMIIGILGCSKAFAATELQLQQKRVMQFCANASLPLLVAGTTYANTSDNGRPEKERLAILKNSVASSTAYKMASPGVQIAGNDSNLLIVFYVQIMPDDFVMQLHRF